MFFFILLDVEIMIILIRFLNGKLKRFKRQNKKTQFGLS